MDFDHKGQWVKACQEVLSLQNVILSFTFLEDTIALFFSVY